MTPSFTLDSPMPPVWIMYPHISQYSIGWRMGYGEGYKFKLGDWKETLSEEQQRQYEELFPHPIFWREYYNPDYDFEDIEDFECGTVQLWHKNGEMQYSREKLTEQAKSSPHSYLFFWKPNPDALDKFCLGQWQPSYFEVDTDEYSCAEQYMMAEKARLFEDTETESKIMKATDPKEMKSLGQKVKNFDQSLWDKAKYSIVLNGNYYKFAQNKDMRDFLLSTGNQILVEASPLDTIWGIGLAEDNAKALDPTTWRGSNLLGFALMEVRDELRKVYKNYHIIDWSKLKEYTI
ncbi:NADAR domain-containing protein [Cytophagaceae bacterium YF14B1]|uniref:NADAR domain-containing protein n=1 Tax=Xanthocytophaga flava TaxID=3048013 RepID=A0AAE3U6E5_9BACT|nr:NADAR domain-containing protein [Xanthocytophaga flavus]MDJ1480497.1 NADAR domain-containing protein [Xanthocytophaga flavus]